MATHSEYLGAESALFGTDDSSVDFDVLEVPMHREVVAAFSDLKRTAAKAGYGLQAASGFRSFERQLGIWNRKARGEQVVLDSYGKPLDITALPERERVFAILRWSALPGASRHHWGTEIDIYDATALGDEALRLDVAETEAGGPFYPMYQWLDDYLSAGMCDFFRPYSRDLKGVAPEPWHLSYAPIAENFAQSLSREALRSFLAAQNFSLKDVVLESLDEIYERFVMNYSRPHDQSPTVVGN